MVTKLITVSDLHVSTPPLDDFDSQIAVRLAAFLSELALSREPTELVINGDFLDFVQAEPSEGAALEGVSREEGLPLCFTERQSLEKLEGIYEAHDDVFVALRDFLKSNRENVITVLPGNHDADLFWSGVQTSLLQRIGAEPGRVRIHLERVYRPAGFPGVWIEHGHQFDPINSFFLGPRECWSAAQPPILTDTQGRQRLLECLGTRFMIRFINGLDRTYPYVDNVKPFSLFVRLFATSALVSGYASLQVAVSMWRLLYYLARTGITKPTDLLSVEGEPVEVKLAMLNRLHELNERSKTLQQRVHREGFRPDVPLSLVLDDPAQGEELMVFLSEHEDLLRGLDQEEEGYLSTSGETGTLSLARGYRIDESKELTSGAAKILTQSGTKLVLMGHTHESLAQPSGLTYLNTGSWTRNFAPTGTEKLRPWSLLKAATGNEFPYALKYAEVRADSIEKALLQEYPPTG